MASTRVTLIAATAVVAVGATGALAWNLTGASNQSGPAGASDVSTDPGIDAGSGEVRSTDALATEFLDEWVDDGRVVRRDQGDDTVSEGQAYGMLLAAGVGDEESFDEIWDWTTANLLRDDGLLAWKWKDGAVIDDEPASDADLDAARALILAGTDFDRPDLTAAGDALGTTVLDRMTVSTDVGRILLPGMWAAAVEPYAYNPSYASPAAFSVLQASTGDARWAELAAGSAAVTATILSQTDLPPDWAQVYSDGRVEPMPGPAGTGDDVRYSYDAARLPLRYAESCTPADVAMAARVTPALTRSPELAAALDLGGTAIEKAQHPLAYAARSAAFAASGDRKSAQKDLAEAVKVSDANPTYYGAAWVALASMMLGTDRLGACPALTA